MKFDHIGIVVSNLDDGRNHFCNIYNITKFTKEFKDEVNGVYIQFLKDSSGISYELVAPINDKSPISHVLSKKINTINHMAYLVEDIKSENKRLLKNNFLPLGEYNSAIAYNMKKIRFYYSKDFNYILELIESIDHSHSFEKKQY